MATDLVDNHFHVGQFRDVYYKPVEIFDIIIELGVKGGMYSSTTSVQEGICYRKVEKEIAALVLRYSPAQFIPLLWYIPSYIDEGLTPDTVFKHIPYGGIKLHPRGHRWHLRKKKHLNCLHNLFGYAHDHALPVIIHTGVDPFEQPNFFETFYATYYNAKIILAHCRPVVDTLELFRRYSNVYGDTAFLPEEDYRLICKSGYADRMLFGTDFPITHYYCEDKSRTLKEQYGKDIRAMRKMVQ